MSFDQTSAPTPIMHQNLTDREIFGMQKDQLPIETPVELTKEYNLL